MAAAGIKVATGHSVHQVEIILLVVWFFDDYRDFLPSFSNSWAVVPWSCEQTAWLRATSAFLLVHRRLRQSVLFSHCCPWRQSFFWACYIDPPPAYPNKHLELDRDKVSCKSSAKHLRAWCCFASSWSSIFFWTESDWAVTVTTWTVDLLDASDRKAVLSGS